MLTRKYFKTKHLKNKNLKCWHFRLKMIRSIFQTKNLKRKYKMLVLGIGLFVGLEKGLNF